MRRVKVKKSEIFWGCAEEGCSNRKTESQAEKDGGYWCCHHGKAGRQRHYGAEVDDGEGWFHGWGVTFEELEDNVGNYSVGIVERDDGTVCQVISEHITFLTPPDDPNAKGGCCHTGGVEINPKP